MEWKYKGGDILTFRNRWFRFDLWDFSGNPEYRCIYSCVNCSSSVHLVVASATRPHDELVKWLSDIQAMSPHRVPVVIVFTHMDHIKTKEARDEFKRQRQRWIDYHNKKVISIIFIFLANSLFSLKYISKCYVPHLCSVYIIMYNLYIYIYTSIQSIVDEVHVHVHLL